jgi:hypothetical protein
VEDFAEQQETPKTIKFIIKNRKVQVEAGN